MDKLNASIAIQIIPTYESTESKLKVIDTVIDYIKSSGLNCVVTPFETVIEGELFELIEILKECFKICINLNQPEVMSYIKIFYNENGVLTIDEKIKKHNL